MNAHEINIVIVMSGKSWSWTWIADPRRGWEEARRTGTWRPAGSRETQVRPFESFFLIFCPKRFFFHSSKLERNAFKLQAIANYS